MKSLQVSVLVLACTVLLSPRHSWAQIDTATIIGTVTDEQNAVVSAVTITARNVDTGFTFSGVTDPEGRYRIAAIPPGRYEFRAERQGFTSAIRRGVTLSLGSESVIDFKLSLASLVEAITVTADTPIVETTTAVVQTSFNRQQLDLLPLIGRNFESLLRLTAGSQQNNSTTAFTGSRGRSNQWTIDGVDNSEDISGYSRQSPAVDSVQEVQVLVNGFKAEHGQASGGIVNAITRSGTNVLHGNGFFLFRNQELMSRSPYANRALPEEPFRRIHYGGLIGGPLRRDKLHFFAAYEREDRDTNTASTRTLPPATASFAPSTRQFLASNGIDPSMFGAGGTVRHVRPEFVNVHKITARVDDQLNAAHLLTFRYTSDRETDPSGTSGTLFDFNGATDFFRTHYGMVNHKWIVSSNKLNEAHLQIGQSFGDWFVSYPALQNVTVSGAFSLGGASNYPQGRTDYVYQIVEQFTWHRSGGRTGDHAIKIGGQLKLFRSDGFFDSNFRGTWTFPNLQAFIDGRPSRFTRRQGNSRLDRPNQIYGVYVQDDWRPTPRLTLNLGLRYDYEGARTEALREVTGAPGPGISRDKNNFGPRLGFAWAPAGSSRDVIYGGSGIYYDQIILNIQGNARFTPPKVIGIRIDSPNWPDPFLGGTLSIPPPDVSIIDPNLVTPYNWNSQLGYRRELGRDLGLDVSFIYNRGYDQVGVLLTNAGAPGTANLLGVGAVRPDPNFSSKSFYTNFGEIRYKGLLVELKKRFSLDFQGAVNYTLSKTEDNVFGFTDEIFYPERPDLNWGPGSTDRRHRVESHVEAELPWDLQLAAIVEYASELPLNIVASARDLNGDGITTEWVHEEICRTINCGGFRYSRNSVRELSTDEANRLRALFGASPIARFENNPKYFNLDLTLQKRVRFGTQSARITVEGFNVLNIPQRRFLDGSTTSTQTLNILASTFGRYLRVEQPRAVQFTVQYDF